LASEIVATPQIGWPISKIVATQHDAGQSAILLRRSTIADWVIGSAKLLRRSKLVAALASKIVATQYEMLS
jgi:hypothetical protein